MPYPALALELNCIGSKQSAVFASPPGVCPLVRQQLFTNVGVGYDADSLLIVLHICRAVVVGLLFCWSSPVGATLVLRYRQLQWLLVSKSRVAPELILTLLRGVIHPSFLCRGAMDDSCRLGRYQPPARSSHQSTLFQVRSDTYFTVDAVCTSRGEAGVITHEMRADIVFFFVVNKIIFCIAKFPVQVLCRCVYFKGGRSERSC